MTPADVLARVEAGTGPDRELDAAIEAWRRPAPLFTASIDDALTLEADPNKKIALLRAALDIADEMRWNTLLVPRAICMAYLKARMHNE